MAFVSLIFMYFIVIAVIACVSTLIGIILFIVSAVMKKKQLNKKKEAWLAGNNNYQIKKTYIIPRVFGFISMIPLVICIISIVYISISPSSNNASGQETEYKSPETVVKEQASVIMEGIVNHDVDSIINMFCEYEKKKDELSGQIEEFWGFIEGDIVSYDEPSNNTRSESTDEFRGVIKSDVKVCVENIKTSTGKTYRIYVCSYYIYADNPEYVGVYSLGIYDEDYWDTDNPYPEDRRKSVGSGEIRN